MRPIGAEKNTFKEMKRRGMSRTGKENEIILTCPCANRLRLARLKNKEEIIRLNLSHDRPVTNRFAEDAQKCKMERKK